MWADEILKAGVGNIAVDLAASFEIAQINQLSRQQTGIVKGKSKCLERMSTKGKHHPVIWLHISNSKKGNMQLSNASFFDRAMEVHNKALNAIYPTLFKDTPQENEAFGTSGT